MKLKINKIKIKDWCIFEDFELEPKDIVNIGGDNETGKSRLASAITWCLNGTDIDGQVLNDVIPTHREQSLSPTVSLDMTIIDDKGIERPLSIEKCFKAGLTRSKEYNGEHTNELKLNGVKVAQKKINEFIETNLCNADLFNMLSNVYVFTEKLKPKGKMLPCQVQREIVTGLLKGIPDENEHIQTVEKYKPLKDGVLKHGNISDYQKELKQELADLQADIDKFHIQMELKQEGIDGDVVRSSNEFVETLKQAKENLENYKKENQEYRESQLLNTNQNQQEELVRLNKKKNEILQYYSEEKAKISENKNKMYKELLLIKNNYNDFKKAVESAEEYLKSVENKEIKETCSHCGSPLDKVGVEKAKKDKSIEITETKATIKKQKLNIEKYAKQYNELKKQYDTIVEPVEPLELIEINQAIENTLKQEKTIVEDLKGYNGRVYELEVALATEQNNFNQAKKNEELLNDISNLKLENKANVKKYGQLKMLEDLSKEFTSERFDEIEEKANELFNGTGIEFKLFRKVETTGEYRETFEIYYNGKEYNKQLSLSTKKLVSYWITLKLQEAYNLKCFLILDNMESTSFEETPDNQVFIITRTPECCPKCNSFKSSRRSASGSWKCECGNIWNKKLTVE